MTDVERESWKGDTERKARIRLLVQGKPAQCQALIEAAASEEQQCPRRYCREVGRA